MSAPTIDVFFREQGSSTDTAHRPILSFCRERLRTALKLAVVLVFALAAALAARDAAAAPVQLDFDTLPATPWVIDGCGDPAGATVAGGVLTVGGDCIEITLPHPLGQWHQTVSNSRGWEIEARLRVADVPEAHQACVGDLSPGAVAGIWADDHRILLIVSFAADGICVAYPDAVGYSMDTTDRFHTYRIEANGLHIRVLVDDVVRIDHVLSWTGAGSDVLTFGDLGGNTNGATPSYWDYFEYDTFAPAGLPTCLGEPATQVGTTGDDTLTGTSGPDVIFGWDGNDTIRGLGGGDRICAGAGADDVRGGPGRDVLQAGRGSDRLIGNAGDDTFGGGRGSDTASFASSATAVNASLAHGAASGQGADILAGVENLVGSAFADRLTGDDGANRLFGKDGGDILDGAGGIDFLDGGGGLDSCLNGETLFSC